MDFLFTKMQGAGNDFIIIDVRGFQLTREQLSEMAVKFCRRQFSIGADGMMAVVPPKKGGDFGMLFFNADGSLAEMCGNGARCIAKYGYEHGLSGCVQRIETTAGLVNAWRLEKDMYKIHLNPPSKVKLCWFQNEGDDVSYVEFGNPGIPHAVLRAEHVLGRSAQLYERGRCLRFDKRFLKGANVNFYEIIGDDSVALATYERGVENFTLACGTGAGAAALVLMMRGLVGKNHIAVTSAGGTLYVDTAEENGRIELYLSGPAATVAEGKIYG